MSLLAQDERLSRRVGAIVLCVLAAAVLFVVFVLDRIEVGERLRVRVYMHTSGGLREGSPLNVAGRAVGIVETIALSPHGAPGPLGGDEGVAITVAIEADVARQLRRGIDVFVASRGVLSERYLEVGPVPADGQPLANGDELLGRDPPSLDRVLQRTWDNLMTFKRFLEEVRPEVAALQARLGELDATIDEQLSPLLAEMPSLAIEGQALVAEARHTRDAVGGPQGLDRFDAMVTRARGTLARTRTMLDVLGARADTLGASADAVRARAGTRGPQAIASIELAIDRTRAAIDKIEPLLATVQDIRSRMARGEGSLGRLMNDPEFPEDAKELGKILKRKPWKVMERPKD